MLCKELKININDLIDNNLEIDIKDNSNNILDKLINQKVILNFDYDYDMDIGYQRKVKVLSVDDEYDIELIGRLRYYMSYKKVSCK